MEDVIINPNMVILKLEDNLVSFPLSEDGILANGTAFESSYEIESHHIIFSLYDIMDRSSKELQRFSYIVDGRERDMKEIFDQGKLQEYVTYILNNVYSK